MSAIPKSVDDDYEYVMYVRSLLRNADMCVASARKILRSSILDIKYRLRSVHEEQTKTIKQ